MFKHLLSSVRVKVICPLCSFMCFITCCNLLPPLFSGPLLINTRIYDDLVEIEDVLFDREKCNFNFVF